MRVSCPPCPSSTSRPPSDASRRPDHKGEGEAPPKLPRLLWRAILAILRPAESAARRLIIAASRGIVVEPPRPRPSKPQPQPIEPIYRKLGLALMYRPGNAARAAPILPRSRGRGTARSMVEGASSEVGSQPRIPAFCLSDPRRYLGPPRPRTCPPHLAPRIIFPGIVEPHRLPPPPSAEDLIDATRLIRRISSLAAALDDLPAEARRFARLQARRKAIAARHPDRPRRVYPIRHTRPPGGRLYRYDPDALHPKNIREVDEILAHAHALAMYALQYPDTS
jgi:hypothetical protein